MKEKNICRICNKKFSWASIVHFADHILAKVDFWGIKAIAGYDIAMYKKEICPACAGHCTQKELEEYEKTIDTSNAGE